MTKKVPSYWWDFESNDAIIVESDDDRFPVVGRFYFESTATVAIDRAMKLIDDLNAGRKDPRSLAKYLE